MSGGGLRNVQRGRVVGAVAEHRSVVLAGEMGVGKSHLLADAVAELRSRGWGLHADPGQPGRSDHPVRCARRLCRGGRGRRPADDAALDRRCIAVDR